MSIETTTTTPPGRKSRFRKLRRLVRVARRLSILLPLLTAVASAAWVLYVYVGVTRHQNSLLVQTGTLDLTKKAALGVATEPRLVVEPMFSTEHGVKPTKYLIVWEVRVANVGYRPIVIEANVAELHLGTDTSVLAPSEAKLLHFNYPGQEGVMSWQQKLWKPFTKDDLEGMALGPLSPGDRTVSELSGVVHGHPGMWIFARSTLIVRGDDGKTGRHVEWAFEEIQPREADSASPLADKKKTD